MNLTSRKYQLIEKIVALQDDSVLSKLEELFVEKSESAVTPSNNVTTVVKKDGIVVKRSIYRIADRPTNIQKAKPIPKKEIISAQKKESDSLSKLQRLVSQQANGL